MFGLWSTRTVHKLCRYRDLSKARLASRTDHYQTRVSKALLFYNPLISYQEVNSVCLCCDLCSHYSQL